MSSVITLFLIANIYAIAAVSDSGHIAVQRVSPACRSVDVWDTPYLPLDVCSNSYSTKYQGSFSEKYVCDESRGYVNRSFYWGHDCLSLTKQPAFSVKVIGLNDEDCYNTTVRTRSSNGDGDRTARTLRGTSNTTTTTVTPTRIITNCTSNDIDYHFNCETSLPDCDTVHHTVYTPHHEVPDCSTDDDETNWITDAIVINQCICHNTSGSISCWDTFCNNTGIFNMWIDTEDDGVITLEDVCAIDMDILDPNDTHVHVEVSVWAGCNEKTGQYHTIDCPEDGCLLYHVIMSYIVSILMTYIQV
eukprot:185899_1